MLPSTLSMIYTLISAPNGMNYTTGNSSSSGSTLGAENPDEIELKHGIYAEFLLGYSLSTVHDYSVRPP